MTTTYKLINFGLEEETGKWFAYPNGRVGSAFAQSEISQEDALLKLCNLLANKLKMIDEVIHKNMDNTA
jgi:hypothetical protein